MKILLSIILELIHWSSWWYKTLWICEVCLLPDSDWIHGINWSRDKIKFDVTVNNTPIFNVIILILYNCRLDRSCSGTFQICCISTCFQLLFLSYREVDLLCTALIKLSPEIPLFVWILGVNFLEESLNEIHSCIFIQRCL